MIKKVEGNIIEMNNIKVSSKNNNKVKNINIKSNKAITLIASVITIIVILILARSKYCNINWGQWAINKSPRSKE